ncbi:MAG: aldehyde dehydrogenase family protein [Bacteroidia bacterium]|nr:aldehyde dehydrogenase family protein [Bacteroidia bacterium]
MNGASKKENPSRIGVLKTYKMFIGGAFPRTESGRYIKFKNKQGNVIANICRASRKDVRNAVVVARKAQEGWANKTAYNKSQILYRIAENLESRKEQLISTLVKEGKSKSSAQLNVDQSIDRVVYYAGWCDKYQQIFSSVNPVASDHFNFTFPEATGVVACIIPKDGALLSLASMIAPILAGGNSVIVLAGESHPMTAIEMSEIIQASDVPGGVINILTGIETELLSHIAKHMDINALVYCNADKSTLKSLEEMASLNVKRMINRKVSNWSLDKYQNPYYIMDTQELKTTWHPIAN